MLQLSTFYIIHLCSNIYTLRLKIYQYFHCRKNKTV